VERDDRLLASLGYDTDLDLPLPDIEDGIRGVSLREDLPILEVVRHVAAAIMGVEELFDVERRGSRSLGQGLVSGADCAGGPVAGLVGIDGGVVSGVMNLESSGVEAPDWRPRHDEHYHEA
jgi:hypothetical protein